MNVFNISIALLLCLCAAVSAKPVTPKECESEDCDMPELEDKPDVEPRNLLHPKNPSEITGLGVSMLLTMCKGPRAKVDVKVPIGCGLCACGANNTFYCTDIPCPRIELPSPDCHWVRSIENCCGYPVCPPGVEIEYPSDWVPATSSRTRRAGEILVIDPAEHGGIEQLVPGLVMPPGEADLPPQPAALAIQEGMPEMLVTDPSEQPAALAIQEGKPENLEIDPSEQGGIDEPVNHSNLKKRDLFDEQEAVAAAVENYNPRVIESVAKEWPRAVQGSAGRED